MTVPVPSVTTPGASLFARYRADAGISASDGQAMSTWLDASGNGHALTGTGAARPTYRATRWSNSRPMVEFARAASSLMRAAAAPDWAFLSNGDPYTVYYVWRSQIQRSSFLYPSDPNFTLWDTCGGIAGNIGSKLAYWDAATGGSGASMQVARGVSGTPPAIVQSTATGTAHTGTSATSGALAGAVTAGNTIIVFVWHQGVDAPVTSVTDSAGNVYVQDKAATSASPYVSCEIWRSSGVLAAGAGLTVTAITADAQYITVSATEVSGLITVSTIDPNPNSSASDSGSSSTGAHDITAGAISTSNSSDIVFTSYATGAQSAVALPAGYTLVVEEIAGPSENGAAAYKVLSAVALSENPTWMPNFTGTNPWAACTIAYRQSSFALNAMTLSGSVLAAGTHKFMATCDGTGSYAVKDWDGATIMAATSEDFVPSAANPTQALAIGGNLLAASGYSDIGIADIVIFKGVLNAADRANWDAYLECLWQNMSNAPSEPELGVEGVYALSGSTQGANPLTKFGTDAIYEPAASSAGIDKYKINGHIGKFSNTDYRIWSAVVGDGGSPTGSTYTTTPDLTVFTKPNLGQVSIGGNTNNNFMIAVSAQMVDVFYDPLGATGQKFLGQGGNANNTEIWISEDGIIWVAANAPTNLGAYKEGKSPLRRSDGRYVVFYTEGNLVDRRQTGQYVSDTTDPTGAWTDQGSIPAFEFTAITNQVYEPKIQVISDNLWIASVSRYNSSTGHVWGGMAVSRDEGVTWTMQQAIWLPFGAGGSWDAGMAYPESLLHVGTDWQLWYLGYDLLHNDPTDYNGGFGYAHVPYGRLPIISGAGTYTTRAMYQGGKVLSVNADASGGTITAACLDAAGAVISGYGDAQSAVLKTNGTALPLTWDGKALPEDQVFRIRYTLTGTAKIYQWSAGDSPAPLPGALQAATPIAMYIPTMN